MKKYLLSFVLLTCLANTGSLRRSNSYLDFWLTAADNSPLQNTIVTDTFHYIAGNYIGYDDGIVDSYFRTGPGFSQPDILGCAVRITVPASDPHRPPPMGLFAG